MAILARRLYGSKIAPRAAHLKERVEQIENGRFEEAINKIMAVAREELREIYRNREQEPNMSEYEWVPKDKSNL